MGDMAPIAVFAYRRPGHLRRTLESLKLCEGFDHSPVIVYGDGPRNNEDIQAVQETRDVAVEMLGDRAKYHFSDTNRGLASSIISGVSQVLDRYGNIIVIEDDLELGRNFLTFMNRALEQYDSDKHVFQVSGYMYEVEELKHSNTAVFLPITVSWGWATWQRAWESFDSRATGWEQLNQDKSLRHRFNQNGVYDYASMLSRQMSGKGESWAIRWYWSVFKQNGLIVFPPSSLVNNIGFDGTGTHGRGVFRSFTGTAKTEAVLDIHLPAEAELDPLVHAYAIKALERQNGGLLSRIFDRFRRILSF